MQMEEPALPDADVRHLIADSLHLALRELLEPSVTHIAPINTIGCFLLQYLTGHPYGLACGGVAVETGSRALTLDAHWENLDAHLYYVWIERPHPDGRVELVDFGARYWKAWAAEEEQLWIGASPPPVVWGFEDALAGARVRYTPHEEITGVITRSLNAMLAEEKPDPVLATWQGVINKAVDHMMATQLGLSYLVTRGIAAPEEGSG